ncbi:retrovirus-related gag-pol polyprotein [Lasius niger]|uniref:Retrovirus-related gag-pol polyprotein n=1 Tax=Lasius niger TaxID=67767 RepID=A0A0J7K7M6_LASNI|nr:retrovirus-related gag-pol polyprotein [Lasius niger]
MTANLTRIETLSKENYDTWKMQMEALLIKNDAWAYVNGEYKKPPLIEGDANSEAQIKIWIKNDNKARSDIILSISPPELKQVKGCTTSREVWQKLESIYQSKGPARKATLLKQLILQRMEDGGDVHEHTRKFFDTVDKLNEMEVEINPDLLSIMLLYSLPPSFQNFRCAIESRDVLPTPEILRIKITEESDARKSDSHTVTQNAMVANKRNQMRRHQGNEKGWKNKSKSEPFKFQCHRCRKFGHKAVDCRSKDENCRSKDEKGQPSAKKSEDVSLYASEDSSIQNVALRAEINNRQEAWCLDSGATSHFCKKSDSFIETFDSAHMQLNLANNASTEIKAKGTAIFSTNVFGKRTNIKLSDALHVPDLRTNLLSVGKITENDYNVIFRKDQAKVIDRNGNVKLVAKRRDGLYYVHEDYHHECNVISESPKKSSNSLITWHNRLGHLNIKDLMDAQRNEIMKGLNLKNDDAKFTCDICLQGKMVRSPFPKKSERESEILEIVHSDICGPMRVESNGKAKYYVTFIDDNTRWCEVRFLKSKDEVLQRFKEFKNLVENQKEKKIKYLQSDNGTEYKSNQFDNFLKEHGIARRFSIAYNPEQNGIAERKNRTLNDMARCLLIQSGLPSSFWAEAISTANHIRNRCPTSSLNGKTPYEAWTGKKPNVSYFREFGCRVFSLNTRPGKEKFDPRSKEGIFLGYSEDSKGYRVWIPSEKKIEMIRDVKFLKMPEVESQDYKEFTPEDSSKDINHSNGNNIIIEANPLEEIDELEPLDQAAQEDMVQEEPLPDTPRRAPGRPRIERTGLRGRPRKLFNLKYAEDIETTELEYAFLSEIPIKTALSGADANEWLDAMAIEMKSIIKNHTWQIVERPKNTEVIGSRIVFRNKFNPDGTIERKKARIVAKGFAQRPGIHFNQTFAPVARMSSVRLLVALAVHYKMSIHQLDITTAYLNGRIQESIYMEPPNHILESLETLIEKEKKGSELYKKAKSMLQELNTDNKVCHLKKSLYGLRQAGRNWYATLDKVLRKYGATPSNADPCVYRIGKNEDLILIAVYVDDLMIASKDIKRMEQLKINLSQEFEIRDLGEIKHCLGIQFNREGNKIAMHQRGYIIDILTRFGMMDSNPVSTPIDIGQKLTRPNATSEATKTKLPYRELIGALMYLAVSTRPDIAFAVSSLSQFNECYDESHWTAAKRVLRYLHGSINLGLVFEPSSEPLRCFVDSDWANCPDDRRSYTGYATILSNAAISWEAKKQRTVALSSTEAEYMGLAEATKESIYLQNFLIELGFDNLTDTTIFNDNLGAKKLAENPGYHSRSKHIDVRHHFIREALNNELIKVEHVSTNDMISDIMTKGLPRPKHLKCTQQLGLKTVNHTDASRPHIEGEC